MSKEMPIKVFAKKVGIDKKEQEWIEKNDKDTHYVNNSALKNSWLSLSYPIYDGDYYFAFINKKARVNAQYNAKANRELRKYITSFLDEDEIFARMEKYFAMQFKDAGSGDTMTREELWTAIVDMRKKNPAPKRESVSEGRKIQDIVRKHKRELQKAQKSGNLELSRKAEDELSNWASSNGEIRGDDEDEFIDWLDSNLDDLVKGKIKENYRVLARKGMGAETKKSIKVGREVDYYDSTGSKRQGKVIKLDNKGYSVQDDQDRKVHKFVYHDRVAAKKLLKNSTIMDDYFDMRLNETKKQEVDAMKKISKDMQSVLKAYQKVSSMGDKTLKDTKHNASYKKVLDARDAILTMIGTLNTQMLLTKEETNLWEKLMTEEMITYRVKKMQRPEEDKFKKSAKMMGLKYTSNKGKDDTVIVVSGTKKKLRDFDSVVRGKSSYGDPSTIKHFDEK